MSATTGPDGEPRLVYLVGDVYRFMYAARRKSGWAYSEINRSLNRGFFPSLAVDPSDRPHVAFIDAGFPPTTEDLWYATADPGSANGPPELRVSISGTSSEGAPILFDASNSSDPDGDPLQFRWDFESDGTWDTAFSSDPTATHMWGDDFVGTVTVAVSDGRLTSTATVPVAIRNVPPRIPSLAASVDSVVRVRLAGEKGHSVTATLLQAGNEIPLLTLVRSPGPPQEASVRIAIDPTANASLRLAYDSLGGEPNHGANPTWVTVAFDDGSSASFERTFNAKHPETGTWIVGLNSLLTGRAVRFAATAHDPGSDDLTLTWAFGDGSALSSIYYNNGASPDPYPSPDANPITVLDARVHTYASPGLYTVTLIVIDDDGGMAILVVHVDVR
ncbi:MAG TPA: PKD domain-containing protein [Thermoplasmata archaeon]|jgi:PKD repeat protein|nr:PKD domain-containing protein [Thermoplasmata archaeon]